MKKPDSVIFKRHLMKLSLEELTAYLKEYEKVRQVKVLDQINQMKQEEVQTKLEVLAPVSACPSCNSDNFVKNGSKYGIKGYGRMWHWALYSAIMNLPTPKVEIWLTLNACSF